MGRAPLVAFFAVLAVALLPVLDYLTEPREVIVSTPSAYTGLTVPLPLPARGEACADEILYDTNARIARFGATAPAGARAPALEVVARGYEEGEYRNTYESVARVAGGWTGTRRLDVDLEPPRSEAFGTFCVRNLGNRRIELVGTEDGRAYSRPSVKVDGQPTPIELELRLLERGRSSLLSRAGQMMEQAATLRPFGAWWWWTLALAVVALAPLGVLLAIRFALTADAALPARERAPAAKWPSERVRRRLAAVPGWAIVGSVGALAVLWFLYWGLNTHVFQNDEDQYVYLSRWLQNDFPATLWNFDTYARGLQRLEVWLLAIPSALFDSPWSLAGGRLLNTVAFVSTAIPVYLLGRGMGLRPQWAALPAAVCAVVPWAVVTTAFLTENVAYPACMWAVWAIWRTTAAPSPRRDLLALLLLVVAGAARSALLLLAPVLPLAVLATGLRCGAGSALARVRGVLRDHVVLWIAVAAAALPLVLAPLGVDAADSLTRRLAGGYPTHVDIEPWALLSKFGSYFSRSVVGTGFFAAAVALPWLALQLVRPLDRNRFAFAAVVVLTAAALLYSLAPAGPDERYVVYLAPLLLLPAVLAIAQREVSPAGLGIASVLLASLLASVSWNPDQGPFGFFVSPAEMFYSRAVGLRLATYIPGDGSDALNLAALLLAIGGVALASVLHWAPGRLAGRPAYALVAAVVAVIVVQTHYTLTKYVNGAGSKSAESLNGRAFVDRAVPDGAAVGELAEGRGRLPDFQPLWQEVQFYNERIETVYTFGPYAIVSPPGDRQVTGLTHDERTGRVISSLSLPEYLVVPSQFGEVSVRGEVVRAPSYVAVALVRIDRPATLAWRARGFEAYGVVPAKDGGEVRFYGTGVEAGANCATFTLTAPVERAASWRIEHRGRVVSKGELQPAERRSVTMAVPRLPGRDFVDLHVGGEALQILNLVMGEGC